MSFTKINLTHQMYPNSMRLSNGSFIPRVSILLLKCLMPSLILKNNFLMIDNKLLYLLTIVLVALLAMCTTLFYCLLGVLIS